MWVVGPVLIISIRAWVSVLPKHWYPSIDPLEVGRNQIILCDDLLNRQTLCSVEEDFRWLNKISSTTKVTF